MTKTFLKLGTDCSGIEAPLFALKNIQKKNKNLEIQHVFSSDVDPYVKQLHKDNFSAEINFDDITQREKSKIPYVDIYVAGFPCQPFSKANKFRSEDDKRKQVFFGCLDVITQHSPKIVIFENVKTLLSHEGGSTYSRIMKELQDLNKYDIYTKVLNTKNHGIPQARDRLYIVCILRSEKKKDFEFPPHCPMKSLKSMLDPKLYPIEPIKEKNQPLFSRIPKGSVFVDIGFRNASFPNSDKWAPCITAQANMWNVEKQRRATVHEYLKLQGFPTDFFVQKVSDHRFKKIIGNAMTVNVVEAILRQALPCVNIKCK